MGHVLGCYDRAYIDDFLWDDSMHRGRLSGLQGIPPVDAMITEGNLIIRMDIVLSLCLHQRIGCGKCSNYHMQIDDVILKQVLVGNTKLF
jgi:hypothetical protein